MNDSDDKIWDGVERRKPHSCRRKNERRSFQERRFDRRDAGEKRRQKLYGWLRSLTKARLGVDRRKNADRRVTPNRRLNNPKSLLTKEELADLLK